MQLEHLTASLIGMYGLLGIACSQIQGWVSLHAR